MKHFYFDQGGLLGKAIVLITDQKLKPIETENNPITDFYVGFMNELFIQDYISLFINRYAQPVFNLDGSMHSIIRGGKYD